MSVQPVYEFVEENASRAQLVSSYMIILAVPLSQDGRSSIAIETAPTGTRQVERGSEMEGASSLGVLQSKSR